MRLWFAPSSEVPIYRQVVTQVVLAILSGDLRPGERLPSTRELARRFRLHPNTISAGYRQLEREGWTEQRRGSGVYVRERPQDATTPEQILDRHIAGFFRAVRELGLSSEVVRERVSQWLASPSPDGFLLIDSDVEVRRILATELRTVTSFPVREASPEECDDADLFTGAVPLCRPSQEKKVRPVVPVGVELAILPIRSANALLSPWMPVPKGHLVGIVSRWPDFLSTAKTMLIAVGLPAESLLVRDARQRNWRRGLDQASLVLCDAYVATLEGLPKKRVVFELLAQDTGAELNRHLGRS